MMKLETITISALLCAAGVIHTQGQEDLPGARQESAIGPKALKKKIEAMRVKDVAWRKIGWKTCLLDGIRESRKQNKPMILWVFIDRPVDDKRC
jgi:hypothetical protein